MDLINPGVYDLITEYGQAQATQDIIRLQNQQFSTASTSQSYRVTAYVKLSITTIADHVAKVYEKKFQHGQGFPPAFLSFSRDTFVIPWNSVDPIGAVPSLSAHAVVDNQYLYLRVKSDGTSGQTFEGNFYIFNVPATVT